MNTAFHPGFQRFTNFWKRRRTLWGNLILESTCTIKAVWILVAWFTTWVHKFSLFDTKVIAAIGAHSPLMKSATQVSKPSLCWVLSQFFLLPSGWLVYHAISVLRTRHIATDSQIPPQETFNCLPLCLLCCLT